MSVYGSVGASSIRPGTGSHQLAAASSTGPAPFGKRKEWVNVDDDDPDARANFSTPFSASSSCLLLGVPRPPPPPPPAEKRPLKQQLPTPRYASVPAVSTKQPAATAPASNTTTAAKPSGNRLLMAGYLAHEFLSQGTLFGRPYGTSSTPAHAATARKEEMQQKRRKGQYEEVARILWWGGGVHVPGVINPTLLGGWLQKKQQDN